MCIRLYTYRNNQKSNPSLMQKGPKVTLVLCRRNATALNTYGLQRRQKPQ